jgi:prevent-host-death family protein
MTEMVMHYVRLEDAANSLFALIQKVMKGEEVFITQDQKPIAKLVSVSAATEKPAKRIKAGSAKGLIKIAEDFDEPLDDFKEYMS